MASCTKHTSRRLYAGNAETPEFPYKKKFHKNSATEIFNNLKNVSPEKEFLTITHKRPLPPKFLPLKNATYKNGKYYILKFKYPDDYDKYHILSDLFIEDVRIRANVQGYLSPYDYWTQNQKPHLSLSEQREDVYHGTRETSQFKNTVAKFFYEHTANEILDGDTSKLRIVDPSAGWGDRLLGALACGAKQYLGYDPNTALQNGYSEMMKLAPEVDANIVPSPFETAELPKNHFHCCLASPPYFNFEVYSKSGDQSILNYDTEDAWLTKFATPMVSNIYDSLVSGGFFFLHLSDNKQFRLTRDVIDICFNHGFKYLGAVFTVEGKSFPKPVWIFKK